MLLGVPAERVRKATRRLSVADLDAAELATVEPSRTRRMFARRVPENVVPIQGGGQ